ncbi:conserved hypothetical protein [Pseudomonas sp. OF001]|jgi:hypothetical protein|uniref:hypothetical protein n=1 Tax=unclassified Pseudomonas TaxID=196821 RepID=UPI0010A664EF|nr:MULTISPECIES: hypothetical protein [unclassified Pseudomonas]THG75908.1 hypothetical protein E5198_18200 [Pseudomonas sp. A-1]WPP44514.1 hypothetical protein SK095_14720 [Pseudomonas sp. AN-1]CAD5376165.1 conserved hypothetical protein [Pseudomonas sp. OF001]
MSQSNDTPALAAERRSGTLRQWRWAFHKVRSLEAGLCCAAWRATRFALLGDSGRFYTNSRGWTRLRHPRD